MKKTESQSRRALRFLILWKDADSGIAEVDDARERLDELKESAKMSEPI